MDPHLSSKAREAPNGKQWNDHTVFEILASIRRENYAMPSLQDESTTTNLLKACEISTTEFEWRILTLRSFWSLWTSGQDNSAILRSLRGVVQVQCRPRWERSYGVAKLLQTAPPKVLYSTRLFSVQSYHTYFRGSWIHLGSNIWSQYGSCWRTVDSR